MMAGMNLNIVSTANMTKPVSSDAPARETIRRTPEIKTADTVEAKTKQQDETEKSKNVNQETLENVVARSEYGDTVQVSDDGANELEESRQGIVTAEGRELVYAGDEEDFSIERPEVVEIERPEIVLPETKEKVPEDTHLESDEMTVEGPPFNGYSSEQLEAFYQAGKISEYTYESEMDRRKVLHDEIIEETKAFTNEMTEVTADASRVQRTDFAIETAINSESKFDIKDRMDAINSADESRKAQARITEEEGRLWDYQLRA